MRLTQQQKMMNVLANRAFLLADAENKIATIRSEEDSAQCDGMLYMSDEFNKTSECDQYMLWLEKYLRSAGEFNLSVEFLSQLYNYIYNQALTCYGDGNLVTHFEVAYSDISTHLKNAMQDPSLANEEASSILDHDREARIECGQNPSKIEENSSQYKL